MASNTLMLPVLGFSNIYLKTASVSKVICNDRVYFKSAQGGLRDGEMVMIPSENLC